jgi:hypothetical protein
MTRALRIYQVSIDVCVEDQHADDPENETVVVEEAIEAARRAMQENGDVMIEELTQFYEEIA